MNLQLVNKYSTVPQMFVVTQKPVKPVAHTVANIHWNCLFYMQRPAAVITEQFINPWLNIIPKDSTKSKSNN